MATSKVATQIRIEEVLYEKLKKIAEKEKRSLNAQMEYFLMVGVEAYQNKKSLLE